MNDGAPGPSPLSDRGKFSASKFGVHQEPERVRQLALLHQPDQNLLPKLGEFAAVGMAEQARGDDVQREGQVALVGKVDSGGDEGARCPSGQQVERRRCFFLTTRVESRPSGCQYPVRWR